jgi:indole-3-glycerol phosphate synthase
MSILDQIVDDTRDVVTARKQEASIADLEQRPLFADHEPISLVEAMKSRGMSFIAEIKKASPSKGVIREPFNPAQIAQQYAQHGADAISVLTEPRHFQGTIEHLPWIRAHVDVPLLRKDFIIDPYQVVEAKAMGADAVLLIATVLDANQLYDLHQTADELGLDCLVEVYSVDDLDVIDFTQIKLLGANNRDLHTFEVDVNNSLRVFEHAPRSVGRISESGLSDPETLVHLRHNGVNGVLIGEHFMRADDPGQALTDLRNAAKEIAMKTS